MPEYVSALYDCLSKPKDQCSFRTGERTAVVEQGNMSINGLWKSHNRTGAVAFSPKSYTSLAAPSIKSPPAVRSITFAVESSRDLDGEPEFTLPRLKQLTAPFPNPGDHNNEDLEGPESSGEGDRVLNASVGDGQMIERFERDADGDVVSFLDVDTETDEGGSEMSDTRHASDVNVSHDWHKSARTKLAEKTWRATQKLEALPKPYPRGEVEGGQAVRHVVFPNKHESEQTVTTGSPPVFQLAPLSNLLFREATFVEEKIPSPASTSATVPQARIFAWEEQKGTTTAALQLPFSGLPSSTPTVPIGVSPLKRNDTVSSSPTNPTPAYHQLVSEDKTEGGENEKDPTEWTVKEVVEWLKGKGIDQNIRDKFVEHEITGDVLLTLDVDLLKMEVGVMGFGKLMCIANAITDLRWPPSRVYSDHPKDPSLFPSGEAPKKKVILPPNRVEDVNRTWGEAVPLQSTRRQPFGLSHDSTSPTGDSSKPSQGTFTPASSPPSDGDKFGAGDKPTFFALPFGKRRKPPPTVGEDVEIQPERLLFSLSKGGNPSSTHLQRPSTHSNPSFKNPQTSSDGPRSPERVGGTLMDGKSSIAVQQGQTILTQIGEPDHIGWMHKKRDGGNSWKPHYFVLKGQRLFWLKSDSNMNTHLEGFIDIVGYKVTMDETLYPGRYGFRIDRDQDKTHFFTSDSVSIIREWVKAIMKATIARDHTKPIISPCTIPTIPLAVAQAMVPAPRPPSPATLRALQRENHNRLSHRGDNIHSVIFPDIRSDQTHLATAGTPSSLPQNSAFLKPKEKRSASSSHSALNPTDSRLVEWANFHLPPSLQVDDPTTSFFGGLALLRLAESIGGTCFPPVPDSAFPVDPTDNDLDGLFRLFDLLLDNGVHTGSVCINDIRQGKRGKILQLLKALKSWEDRRGVLAATMNGTLHPGGGGAFSVPTGMWADIPELSRHWSRVPVL